MGEGLVLPAAAKAKVDQADAVRVSAETKPLDAAIEAFQLGLARLGIRVRIQGLTGDYMNYRVVHLTAKSSNPGTYDSFILFCQ